MSVTARAAIVLLCASAALSFASRQPSTAWRRVAIRIDSRMAAPRWATLERQLLADNVPACREFFHKYFDDRGYLQCVVRWGANDGPDDAFENFNRWPELHALGAERRDPADVPQGPRGTDEAIHRGSARPTCRLPAQGMYYKEFIVQSDWMHHGEGLQLFNRMGLSIPDDAKYQERARRFAGFLHGRGSRGAQLRSGPQDHPQHAERQPRADAPKGDAASTGSAIRSMSVDFDGAPRRVDLRAIPRALRGIRRRRRRPFPESGRHDAADRCVSASPANPNTRNGSSSTWTPGWIG